MANEVELSFLTGEELPEEKPKKKRGRPSKAELAARAALEAQEKESEEVSQEAPPAEADNATIQEEPKRRRTRRTKAEIIMAAEAAAVALAQSNLQKASLEKQEQDEAMSQEDGNGTEFQSRENASDANVNDMSEEFFGVGGTDNTDGMSLIEQLQSKMKTQSPNNEKVWAEAPDDDTDFIIVRDVPVEDNAVIPYYDMFDNPNMSSESALPYDDEEDGDASSEFDFSDIVKANGVLEIMPDGYGFLRSSDYNYLSSPDDVHLTIQQVRGNFLKTGDVVECMVRPPHGNEKYFTMSSILKVNGRDPRDIRDRISFENLTPLFPEEKFTLCAPYSPDMPEEIAKTTNISTRIVDLFSPIGKGQRSLIVAQPKTGKTILMKDIANAIAANHPEAYIMMLLIDERPEEVTDMARTVNAEVIASTFDEPADRHVKIAGLVLEKAKRLVECGHDVVIFLDSITRLARAYNTVAPASGKVLTGGVDANALQKPKRFFGAARNIEDGGSLTIIATALTDTGSKMDEVIFEEFKGTGNSELQLDRQLANKRIFPAVNLIQSSTRRDDLLLDETTINRMWILRKGISDMNSVEAMTRVHDLMKRTRNHTEFFMAMNS